MLFPIPLELKHTGTGNSVPVANLVLILVNAAVFAFGWGQAVGPASGPMSVLLYGFSHWGLWHLVFNMWALWVFGNPVNRRLGGAWYTAAYLGTIVAVGLATRLFLPGYAVGASGALFAVIVIALVLMPRSVVEVAYLALFPLTLLFCLLKLPRIWLHWFVSWGTVRIPALASLVLVPLMEILSLFWHWWFGCFDWAPLGHLLGMACGVVVVLMLPARISMGRRSAAFEM